MELRSATGTVVRPDRYDGYFVIKLDQPATYFAADGTTRDLPELQRWAQSSSWRANDPHPNPLPEGEGIIRISLWERPARSISG